MTSFQYGGRAERDFAADRWLRELPDDRSVDAPSDPTPTPAHPKCASSYEMFTGAEARAGNLSEEPISTGGNMPQIIVIADSPAEDGDPPIMFRERVSVSDFESQHFATQLVERLGWAVGDADEAERRPGHGSERRLCRRRSVDEPRLELAGVSADPARPVS
jgi:hypothetical protein